MIVKAGSTELTRENAIKIYNEKKYICNYSGVYRPIMIANGGQIYFRKVIDVKGYAPRGRYFIHDVKTINNVLGKEILIDL